MSNNKSGVSWQRKVMEIGRQTLKIGEKKGFVPTSNTRNEIMFKEATDLAKHLQDLHQQIQKIDKSLTDGFTSMRQLLVSPLPRAYRMNDQGEPAVVPIEAASTPVGGAASEVPEQLMESARMMHQRLGAEVLAPIGSWMATYNNLKAQLAIVEDARLELDVRRRKLIERQSELAKAKEKSSSSQVVETLELNVKEKEFKLDRALQHFDEQERTFAAAIAELIHQSKAVRNYVIVSLDVLQATMQTARASSGNPIDMTSLGASLPLPPAYPPPNFYPPVPGAAAPSHPHPYPHSHDAASYTSDDGSSVVTNPFAGEQSFKAQHSSDVHSTPPTSTAAGIPPSQHVVNPFATSSSDPFAVSDPAVTGYPTGSYYSSYPSQPAGYYAPNPYAAATAPPVPQKPDHSGFGAVGGLTQQQEGGMADGSNGRSAGGGARNAAEGDSLRTWLRPREDVD